VQEHPQAAAIQAQAYASTLPFCCRFFKAFIVFSSFLLIIFDLSSTIVW
jgi:hypothetical protein